MECPFAQADLRTNRQGQLAQTLNSRAGRSIIEVCKRGIRVSARCVLRTRFSSLCMAY